MDPLTTIPNQEGPENSFQTRLKFAHFPYIGRTIENLACGADGVARVLDIGCGPGNLPSLSGLNDRCRWYGLDLWEHQLQQARDKGVYESLFQVNLVEGLPFRDSSFDVLVCNEVLMYLPNAEEMLDEFHRVLRPGGRVLVYNPISWIPTIAGGLKRIARKIYQEKGAIALDTETDWKRSTRPCRITYYSFHSMIDQVRSAGFRITEVTGFRLFRSRFRALGRLENYAWYRGLITGLSSRFPYLASDLMVVAEKE